MASGITRRGRNAERSAARVILPSLTEAVAFHSASITWTGPYLLHSVRDWGRSLKIMIPRYLFNCCALDDQQTLITTLRHGQIKPSHRRQVRLSRPLGVRAQIEPLLQQSRELLLLGPAQLSQLWWWRQ